MKFKMILAAAMLSVRSIAFADTATITVHADKPVIPSNKLLAGVCLEDVNHEVYGGIYSQMIFGESFAEPAITAQVSGMWKPVTTGSAAGQFTLDKSHPFTGAQSQALTFESGSGDIGIENRGLNHWGMNYVSGKPYDGYLYLRSVAGAQVVASLESADGSKTYAQQTIDVTAGDWKKYDLSLTPNTDDHNGRFAITLKQPSTVEIGYVFLEPGEWARFKGLPVRKDVAEMLLTQGVTVMRYGGSMVNSPSYHWKQMIGPREHRPIYEGHWYPYSTNGFGVMDFLNLAEQMGIVGIPDLNVNESPQDMADFIEYVNGDASTEWGHKRVADGHPQPYQLKYLELGNEESVNESFAKKFNDIANLIWAKDPQIILIAGDFAYHQPVHDPDHISGSDGQIANMNGHRQILDFAGQHHREVWFDVHVWSENLEPSDYLRALPSFIDAIDKLAGETKHRVVVFELNANAHGIKRALANAVSINTICRDNRVPIVISANALQPDHQNDNGWDQGLLFLNPWMTWLQPPGYVTQMQARNDLPNLLPADLQQNADSHLDVTATASDDGKTLVLQVVNTGGSQDAAIDLGGYSPHNAHITELAGDLNAANTAEHPTSIQPSERDWVSDINNKQVHYTFPAHSFTVIRFE